MKHNNTDRTFLNKTIACITKFIRTQGFQEDLILHYFYLDLINNSNMDVSSDSSDSGSSETVLNFSVQVKARIPLYSTQKVCRSQRLNDKDNLTYVKNRYGPEVLVDNWYEKQLQIEYKADCFKLKKGPHETTYDVEFQNKVPFTQSDEAFNKPTKRKSHKLMTFYKSPTEYSVNFYRVKKENYEHVIQCTTQS